jgi:GNAT superfamily N-acetyltransferase
MKFERYTDCSKFTSDTMEILQEHESQNTHTIGTLNFETNVLRRDVIDNLVASGVDENDEIITKLDELIWNNPESLLATIKDSSGGVLLTAHCSFPYDKMTLFATRNKVDVAAVKHFANELKAIEFKPQIVRAEQSLAECFANEYGGEFKKRVSLYAMQLDKVIKPPQVSGFCRPLEEKDLHYAPFWKAQCLRDCGDEPLSLNLLYRAYSSEINENKRYLWEDTFPVSQANIADETENCVAIADVYTPPFYRKKGYATALVAELSQIILNRGKRFCVLFADSTNPTSCELYRKVGYNVMCIVDEIKMSYADTGKEITYAEGI